MIVIFKIVKNELFVIIEVMNSQLQQFNSSLVENDLVLT